MALITTLFLQVLSNLANDLGDAQKGTDNADRIGPERAVQSGAITVVQMKRALYLFGVLSLVSGITLIYFSFGIEKFLLSMLFLALGLTAIWASVKYTLGKNAYGYRGRGDLSVFLFFGLTAVIGVYFLISKSFNPWVILPASTMGLFAAGVLNLNNLRDCENDKANGKNTIIVKIGFEKGRFYHLFLLATGWILMLIYIFRFQTSMWWFLELITLPFFIQITMVVLKIKNIVYSILN